MHELASLIEIGLGAFLQTHDMQVGNQNAERSSRSNNQGEIPQQHAFLLSRSVAV